MSHPRRFWQVEARDRALLARSADWGAVWLADLSRFRSTAWLGIAAGIGAAYALTVAAGGTTSGLPHLFYLPIFFAAFVYGWSGGVFAGLVAGLVCGLLISVDTDGTPQNTSTWLVRLVAYVLAGGIVGVVSSSLRARLRQLQQVNAQVVFAFARAIDVMHRDTAEHSGTVSTHAVVIAHELGLDRQAIERVRWASLLHDVGKLAVPREVLDKPGRLTASEGGVRDSVYCMIGKERHATEGDPERVDRSAARWSRGPRRDHRAGWVVERADQARGRACGVGGVDGASRLRARG